MMKPTFFFAIVIVAAAFPAAALADNATSTPATTTPTTIIGSLSTPTTLASSTPDNIATSSETSGLQVPPEPQILQQIDQARQQLDAVKLKYALSPVYKNVKNKKTGKTTKTLTGYNLWAKDIALAILDPSTGQISVTMGMQTGKTIKFSDPNFEIKLTRFNGVNSSFSVSKPQGGAVLALKYLITGQESGSKSAIENALQEVTYVPYSSGFNSPDVIAYGEQYIDGIITRVASDLQTIPSQAIPGKTIPEAIKPALIRALVYAEHTDTSLVMRGDAQSTINQLDILLATNQGDAYKYSVSSAGARGIAQFMPATYAGLVQRHPEANLNPDFVAGMSDHYNSIKAMYLLLDDYAGAVRAKATGYSEGLAFDYGAAAYNGGTVRVINAVNTFGQNWNQDQSGQINSLQSQASSLKSQIRKTKDKKTKANLQAQLNEVSSRLSDLQSAALRSETVNYLQKIYKVIPVFNNGEQI